MSLLLQEISQQACPRATVNDFFRFPHTPHVAWLADGEPRGDKLLSTSEIDKLLSSVVVVEEKVDGANLGFSVGCDGSLRIQNRGHYLTRPFTGQFEHLAHWIEHHEDALFDKLGESLILFREWCAARHSLDYQRLPDFFVGFDVYDRVRHAFWSIHRRDRLLESVGLPPVHCIKAAKLTLGELEVLVTHASSSYRRGNLEGIVIRQESSDWLQRRAKLVRPEFSQTIDEHWRKRRITWNTVAC